MEQQNQIKQKTSDKLLRFVPIGVFLVLVFGFTFWTFVSEKRTFSNNENRLLAQMPAFTVEKLLDGSFGSEYETYLSDQFFLRDSWIYIKTCSELALLKQDINGVYFGKDGYLIEKHDVKKVDTEILNRNLQRMADFITKYAKELGSDHVKAMLVPTASDTLQNKLPAFATGFDQKAMREQASSLLPENTFVDVSGVLKSHAAEYIYYRTDHHWTTLGAYYAYEAWAKACGLTPIPLSEYKEVVASEEFFGTLHSKVNVPVKPDTMYLYEKEDAKYEVEYNMDGVKHDSLYVTEHLEGKDKYSVYLGGNNALVEINSENKNGQKLLIIKDSFSHCFTPFVLEHFETTYLVDFRYFNTSISQFIEEYGITDVLVLYNEINLATDSYSLHFTR